MSARSPVFKTLVASNMQENASGVVNIQDFKIGVVKAMVLYVYTAQIEDTSEDLVELMKIGVKYFIQALVDVYSVKRYQ